MKKKFYLIGIIILAFVGAIVIYNITSGGKVTNNLKHFNDEYTLLSDDNVFVYKTVDEIIKILEDGTGVVFLGFPECSWCQQYVIYLNELAKQNKIKEIYYYNIKAIRNDNTEKYKKIVSLLDNNLPTDDAGNKRVYVPNVTFVKNGVIIANDNETSLISDGSIPKEYWTPENISIFNSKMNNYFEKYTGTCTNCN